MELLTSTSSPQYTTTDSAPQSPSHSSTQYTTSTHYTADATQYTTPHSAQYNTQYSSNGRYYNSANYTSGEDRIGRYGDRPRLHSPDKGLFDDI